MADHLKILDNNRAQLLDDAFVLASVHMVPYQSALNLTLYLKHETEYVPWNAVLSELNYIDTMLYAKGEYPNWEVRISLNSIPPPSQLHVIRCEQSFLYRLT